MSLDVLSGELPLEPACIEGYTACLKASDGSWSLQQSSLHRWASEGQHPNERHGGLVMLTFKHCLTICCEAVLGW